MDENRQIEIISDIVYEYIKSKHKDTQSKEIAKKIVEALRDEPPTWYIHG